MSTKRKADPEPLDEIIIEQNLLEGFERLIVSV
jgi:hypothetical protein